MTKKEFIEKAIEGGWRNYSQNNFGCFVREAHMLVDVFFVDYFTCECKCLSRDEGMKVVLSDVLLDYKAWQAVGKIEKWPEMEIAHGVDGDGIEWNDTKKKDGS